MPAESRTLQILITAKNEADKVISGLQGRLSSAEDASKSFALGMAGMAVAVGSAGIGAIKLVSDLENLQMSFTTMLGSADKAKTFVGEIRNMARATPFESEDIAKASQTLLAFGTEAKNVLPTIQMLGDISLGNKEKLGSLTLAFAQMQSAGKLMGGDLIQMVNAGFNPLQVISQQTGQSMGELREQMGEGAISAQQVADAFKTATAEGGRFHDGMANASTTLSGMWSTLTDDIKTAITDAVYPYMDSIKALIPQILQLVSAFLQLIPIFVSVAKFFADHQLAIYLVVGAIVGALIPAIWSLVAGFAAMAIALAPFIIGGIIIAGIIAGIVWIVKNWDMLKAKGLEVVTAIKEYFIGLKDSFKAVWNEIAAVASNVVGGIKSTIFGMINSIIEKINSMVRAANTVSSLGSKVGINVPRIPEIPMLAKGGIVTKPTLAMIGEAGAEAVVPLNRKNNPAFGQSGVTIIVNGDVSGMELIEKVKQSLIGSLSLNQKLTT